MIANNMERESVKDNDLVQVVKKPRVNGALT